MNHSDLKTIEFAAHIGLDWADQKHDICLQENHSHRVESLRLDHKPDAISNWAAELRQRFQWRPLAVALEQKRGALLYALMRFSVLIIQLNGDLRYQDGQLLGKARISAISSTRGAKNERASVRRKVKRAINEKQGHEIWMRKVGE